jgi:hypothetical protein
VGDNAKLRQAKYGQTMASDSRSRCVNVIFGIAFVLLFSFAAFAQEPGDIAPPPIKMLSKSEKADLSAKSDPKQRTALALELMNKRLSSAEKFRTDENYSLMYAELGGFNALMDDTISFLLKANSREGKQLNSLKKLEIGLRSFTTRLEIVRRDLPSNFDPYLKALIKNIDDAREKAMAPFFSDTVISNSQQ